MAIFNHFLCEFTIEAMESIASTSQPVAPPGPWCSICRKVAAKRKRPAASVLLTQSPEAVERAKCQSVAWQSWSRAMERAMGGGNLFPGFPTKNGSLPPQQTQNWEVSEGVTIF